jgi:hypothetical protein
VPEPADRGATARLVEPQITAREEPEEGRAKRGFTTRTSNDGLQEVSEMLAATGSPGRDPITTRHASNTSALMMIAMSSCHP